MADNAKHLPLFPGMELEHSIKVEVHKSELERLRQSVTDFEQIVAENETLKQMVSVLQHRIVEETKWISVHKRFPTEADGRFPVMWEDGMLDTGFIGVNPDEICYMSGRSMDSYTGDEGHSIEWWMPAFPIIDKDMAD